ncbi:MAG: ferritin-like domain-containing protein, partial [Alphaproteobacteria bacterium]|nr:ferritin-like domain-containing protein [Alphaproteobacteria bacterium]
MFASAIYDTATHTAPVPALDRSPSGAFKVGSDAHKRAFCSVLIDVFDPYKPSVLAWPKLSADAEKRLTSLPFWNIAVQTEGFASSRMQAMADTIVDPTIKEALSLNAFEEGRHKLVIRNMLRFYGIPLQEEKPYSTPQNAEALFIRTGYGECFDSFFAFGLFKMAKDSGYFPP